MLGEDDDSGELRREFIRTMTRTEPLDVEVHGAGGGVDHASSGDISLSGIYVETDAPPPAGAEVQLLIGSLSGSAHLRIGARVVHSGKGGFGARFVVPAEEARAFLEALIRRLRRES